MQPKISGFAGRFCVIFLVAILLAVCLQCSSPKNTAAANLPSDILGLKLGMDKEDAVKHLEEIAKLDGDLEKRQQLWQLNDTARFDKLAVGYSRQNKVRYITALVDKETVKEKIAFSNVGDISAAKQEILKPHHRYIWIVEEKDNVPAYIFTIYGDNPDFLTTYSLAVKPVAGESEEEENE